MENILLSRLLISSIMLDVGLSLESLGKVKLMSVYPQTWCGPRPLARLSAHLGTHQRPRDLAEAETGNV